MTKSLQQAFAYTNNIFIRDMGTDDLQKLFKVTEIAVPPEAELPQQITEDRPRSR